MNRLFSELNITMENRDDVLDVKTYSPEKIAEKHGVDIDVINAQLEKGIKVEKEHTTDEELAKEIALDHLLEIPDYYDKLEEMENK